MPQSRPLRNGCSPEVAARRLLSRCLPSGIDNACPWSALPIHSLVAAGSCMVPLGGTATLGSLSSLCSVSWACNCQAWLSAAATSNTHRGSQRQSPASQMGFSTCSCRDVTNTQPCAGHRSAAGPWQQQQNMPLPLAAASPSLLSAILPAMLPGLFYQATLFATRSMPHLARPLSSMPDAAAWKRRVAGSGTAWPGGGAAAAARALLYCLHFDNTHRVASLQLCATIEQHRSEPPRPFERPGQAIYRLHLIA